MKRQSGVTLGGMMMFLLLLIMVLYTATRIAPGYMDYWLVGRAMDTLLAQPNIQNGDDENIRAQFDKQLRFNNITQVKRSDLLIERLPGGLHLSVAFSVKRPFIGPISLCLDFEAEAGATH